LFRASAGYRIVRTMQSISDDERKEVLGEVLMDELKAIREGIADLPTRRESNEVKEVVKDLKSDMKVVKAAVTDLSSQVKDHDRRITHLEAA